MWITPDGDTPNFLVSLRSGQKSRHIVRGLLQRAHGQMASFEVSPRDDEFNVACSISHQFLSEQSLLDISSPFCSNVLLTLSGLRTRTPCALDAPPAPGPIAPARLRWQ